MSAPLHILIANNIYPPIVAGGAELIVSYLAEGLAAKGHQVTVVSSCGPEMEPHPIEQRNGVEVIRFFPKNLYWGFTRGERPVYQKTLWHLRDAWNRDAGKRFNAILQEKKPDLLHTHLIDGFSAILWRRAKQSRTPIIHTAHDYHLLCPRSLLLTRSLKLCTDPQLACRAYRHWHLRTARDVDLFCSPSQFLLDKHEEAGLKPKRSALVRNGIPLPAPSPKIKAASTRRFLFISRLTREKGCEVLLEAMKKIQRNDFELVIAGKGPLEPMITEAAIRDPRIRFIGYVSGQAKEELFRESDCLLIPSLWYENAPVVIAEAAAHGIGVIGSRIGAIPEFVQEEKTGLLFEPGNSNALAAAMQRVIAEETLLSAFSQNTAPLARASSVDRMVDAYENHYRELLAPQL